MLQQTKVDSRSDAPDTTETPARKRPRSPQITTSAALDERDASNYLNLSVPWLRKARRTGAGPAFLRIGRTIRYTIPDLDAYQRAHRIEPRETR